MSDGPNQLEVEELLDGSALPDERPPGVTDWVDDLSSADFHPASETPDDEFVIESDEPWFDRLRIFVWPSHQVSVTRVLLVCLVGMSLYFGYLAFHLQGLVDVDRANRLSAQFQVDINTAEIGEIVVLPGVGKKLAQAIIDWRESTGGFRSNDQLLDVPGIGEKKLESLRPFLQPID